MTNHSRTKVLMAGVVPPPVHGASLATQALFAADLSPIDKTILEIRSSKNLEEVGRASLSKIFGLFTIIFKALRLKWSSRASVLYYTPGSGALVPFVRDILFLGCCRPFFKKTCLHYHSGGLVDYLNANPVRKFFGRHIYGRKAWAITLSKHVAVPSIDFGAEREVEIPNGIAIAGQSVEKQPSDTLRILFLGNLFESKGVFDLLLACQKVTQRSANKIRLQFVGKWPDAQTEQKFSELVQASPQAKNLEIPAPRPLYGDDKWHALSQSDLFIFPSYYALENFPLVLLEAMAFGLPVIATNWRGIPSIVEEGVSGFLHDIGNVDQLAHLIELFIKNPHLLQEMGEKGKARYLGHFTFEKHRDLMIQTLQEAGEKA